MPWYFPWSDPIKKRACRYLLERYLGCYLEQKLTLDQLNIDLYKGTGCISDVALDVEALNEVGEQYNLPVEIVDGYLGEVHISIPWKNLLTDNCFVEIRGLTLTVQPKTRDSTASVLESMTASMTSSIQMAQDVLSSDEPKASDEPVEGVELFAKHIDAFFSRVKVRFLDTVLRFEHVPENASSGVGIEVRVKSMDFFDEAGVEKPLEENDSGQLLYEPAAFVTKGLHLEGVRFYCHEFPSDLRTFSRSLVELSSSKSGEGYRTAPMSPVSEATSDTPSLGSSFYGDGSSPILFAKLSGLQQVRTRLKQNDQIQGPKVDLELRCGSLVSFLTPRQLHVLLKIAEGILNPHTEDTSNLPEGGRSADKPMSAKDFEKIEQQLQFKWNYHEEPRRMGGLLQQGWSSQCLDSDEEFAPMGGCDSMTGSRVSDISSVSTSSELSSATYPPRYKGILGPPQVENPLHRRRKKTRRSSSVCSRGPLDDGVQTTRFTVSVSMVAVSLMHEDVMTPSVDMTWLPAAATAQEMQVLAEGYFNHVGIPALPGYRKDFSSSRQQFQDACNSSHLRLLLSPLNIEGKEVVSPTKYSVSASISAGSLELVESLSQQKSNSGNPTIIELIKFKQEQSNKGWGEFSSAEPDVKINLAFTEPLVPSPNNCTKLMLQCTMSTLESEVDITLIDRLDSLIHPPELCFVRRTVLSQNLKTTSPRDVMLEKEPGCSLELSLSAPKAAISFRFPIPDLRPIHNMDRSPRWLRNVRREVAVFHLDQPTFKTALDPLISKSSFDLSCRSACINWKETPQSEPVPLIRAEGEEDTEQMGFGLVRVLFHMYEEQSSLVIEENEDDSSHRKISEESDSFCHSITGSTQHPQIFNTQKVFYNNLPDAHDHSNLGECEELLIPGSKADVCEWVEDTSRNCQYHLELHLPAVEIHLPDKRTYELLYNRLNSDLLLWEPSAPKLYNFGNKSPGVSQDSTYQTFSMCKSGIYYESTSDSEEDTGMYYSIFDPRQRKKRSLQTRSQRQSYFFFTIDSAQAAVTAYVPVIDKDGKETGGRGMVWIGMDDLGLAVVSGHHGDMNRGYISFTGHNASVAHRCVTTETRNPLLSGLDVEQPSNLRGVITASDLGVLPNRDSSRDIITVSVAINRDRDNGVKTFTVSGGIYGAILQYKMETWTDTWLSQLLNYFDVLDYPVLGYEPLAVLTELHLHLWDCAIDYKPIHLPYHAVVCLERLHISSNLAAGTNNSCLRFIAEECSLWLSDRQLVSPNLCRDHVCVAHLILFNLALRLHEGKDSRIPKHDLTIYNNKICLRTCADSCKALTELLTYVAGEGDYAPSANSSMTSVASNKDENGNPSSADKKQLTKDQVLEINTLMADAMKEGSSNENSPQGTNKGNVTEPVEVFFFPGENQRDAIDSGKRGFSTESLISEALEEEEQDVTGQSDEEEFCILDKEAGTGIKSRSGEPTVRFLTSEPINLIDNYFTIPVGKGDILRAPQHFPYPTTRYTLREMNVEVHVFGGRDFQSTPSDKDPAKKIEYRRDEGSPKDRRRSFSRYSSDSRSSTPSSSPHTPSRPCLAYSPPTVTFSRGSLNEVRFGGGDPVLAYSPPSSPSTPLANKSPKHRGGPARRHDVLMQFKLDKVLFRHEIYPTNSKYASRHVLAIKDIEIIDRIATSSINKFLYQYSSECMPRQSHANTLLVKAVHTRPDPNIPTEECKLKVSCLPLRLNIDQDAIFFLHDFFSLLSDGEAQEVHTLKPSVPSPIITVQSQKNEDDNSVESEDNSIDSDVPSSTPPTYFRSVRFHPSLPIRVDYHGKRVDWEQHGPLIGLIIGLGQLQCSQIQLREFNYRQGILGLDRLLQQIANDWINDIKRNQLPSLLGGVGPMHSLIQFLSGFKDLVWLPVEQYQKDGRIFRGIQRGTHSFTSSTAYAAIELTTKLLNTIQSCAETAYDMLSPGPSVRKDLATKRRYSTQPMDVREGVSSAYQLMKQGLGDTAEGLARAASREHHHKGAMGAVGGVMRQLPRSLMEPVILATQATSHVLGGARNQLIPDSRKEEAMKWRTDDRIPE